MFNACSPSLANLPPNMPPLPGFSDSSFQSHADFKTASIALLRALKAYQSPGGARIRLPLVTGTHFDDVAAQLEGFARALWAVGALTHASNVTKSEYEEFIEPFVKGLANGANPDHPEYWGPVILRDQRMVEMEIISFALLAAPDTMFHSQSEEAKHDITEWLKTINGKDFPITNWLWFRVMTNLALVKVCSVPHGKVVDAMKADLDLMEQFYLGDGWAADGMWSDNGRQADYYSGSFAIQFSQLIYAKMAQDIDPVRCERFRNRAKEFALSFWKYFDTNGKCQCCSIHSIAETRQELLYLLEDRLRIASLLLASGLLWHSLSWSCQRRLMTGASSRAFSFDTSDGGATSMTCSTPTGR